MKLFSSMDDVVRQNQKKDNNLGSGSFASVCLVSHKSNPNQLYAMKEVEKRNIKSTQLVHKEIKLHTTLNHPHIIKFVDFFETQSKVYIFLEFAKNGDMFGYINKHKLPEQECLRLFYQTCEGIRYIHSKNIMHRDLKPENILIDENINVKVADFGWSAEYFPHEVRQTLCGTYEYMAPEIFYRKPQTKKTDIWALGILLYELFHGHAPYRGNTMEEVISSIMKNMLAFKKTIDPMVKILITKILNFEPNNRPTIEDILDSELIKNFLKKYPHYQVKCADDKPKELTVERSYSSNRLEKLHSETVPNLNRYVKDSKTGIISKKMISGEENIAPKQEIVSQKSISQNKIIKTDCVTRIDITELKNPSNAQYVSKPSFTKATAAQYIGGNNDPHKTKITIGAMNGGQTSFTSYLNKK